MRDGEKGGHSAAFQQPCADARPLEQAAPVYSVSALLPSQVPPCLPNCPCVCPTISRVRPASLPAAPVSARISLCLPGLHLSSPPSLPLYCYRCCSNINNIPTPAATAAAATPPACT